jgi:hypothetical protein
MAFPINGGSGAAQRRVGPIIKSGMLKLFSNGDKNFYIWPQSKIDRTLIPTSNKPLVFARMKPYPS